MNLPGAFTISIDLELAWGQPDIPYRDEELEAVGREREIVRRLCMLFERYSIRATWAVVGHLLMREPAVRDAKGRAHPALPRPMVRNEVRDWFFQLPAGMDANWYAMDLIEAVRAAAPQQEIGSHSFSHLLYDEQTTLHDAVANDLAKARELHRREGLPFDSFVFPRNQVGYRQQLADAGLKAYRGHTPRWQDDFRPAALRRMFNLLTFVLGIPPGTVVPTRDRATGLVNVPDSMLLMSRNGLRRLIRRGNLVRMAGAGLDCAAKSGRTFHLWFHPSNFSHHTEEQLGVLEDILRHAVLLRDKGQLELLTMGDHARRLSSPDAI